jgi:hypothetical protein
MSSNCISTSSSILAPLFLRGNRGVSFGMGKGFSTYLERGDATADIPNSLGPRPSVEKAGPLSTIACSKPNQRNEGWQHRSKCPLDLVISAVVAEFSPN